MIFVSFTFTNTKNVHARSTMFIHTHSWLINITNTIRLCTRCIHCEHTIGIAMRVCMNIYARTSNVNFQLTIFKKPDVFQMRPEGVRIVVFKTRYGRWGFSETVHQWKGELVWWDIVFVESASVFKTLVSWPLARYSQLAAVALNVIGICAVAIAVLRHFAPRRKKKKKMVPF
jgi:hypothetical protein